MMKGALQSLRRDDAAKLAAGSLRIMRRRRNFVRSTTAGYHDSEYNGCEIHLKKKISKEMSHTTLLTI